MTAQRCLFRELEQSADLGRSFGRRTRNRRALLQRGARPRAGPLGPHRTPTGGIELRAELM